MTAGGGAPAAPAGPGGGGGLSCAAAATGETAKSAPQSIAEYTAIFPELIVNLLGFKRVLRSGLDAKISATFNLIRGRILSRQ
jgi:hypothetical protein